jgi:hypothetical protein
LNELPAETQISNDWIIALTDGADNGSNTYGHTKQTVVNALKSSDVNVVIIGIGKDVQTQVRKKIMNLSLSIRNTIFI